ncbi:MAG: carbohydrate ABC transporter permease [Spirochaetales bacterium]|nr:carbohydrate ABC transporter permease [Spirochaetales bacterium]
MKAMTFLQFFNKKRYGIISYNELRNKRTKILYFSLLAFALIVVFISAVPIIWILLSSMKDIKELFEVPPTIIPRTFHPEKIVEVWNKMNFFTYYKNSFIMVGGSIVCAVIFNGILAYVLSILKPKGTKFVYMLVLWSLMIPNIISLVPIFKNIVSLKMLNSFIPLCFSFGANAFFVVLYKSFFDAIPVSLIEAAKMDGCSNLRIFFQIVFPLSQPINIVIAIFAFNAAWSDFLLSFLVLKRDEMFTVMVKLYTISQTWGFSKDLQLMGVFFSIIPPIIIFLIFQKYIIQGIAFSGIKG